MPVRTLIPILALSLLAGACDAAITAYANGDAAAPQAQATATPVPVEQAVLAAEAKPALLAEATAEATVEAKVQPEDLDLETITFLVKKGKVKDAAALEKQINNPKEKLNNIDIDGDGKVDKIVIDEVKGDDGIIVFQLKAIPSKSKDKDAAVLIAHVHFTPDKTSKVLIVKATYAPIVIGHATIVYDYTTPIVVQNDVVVVHGGFHGWLFAVHRPVYHGVVIYEVAPPPVIIIDYGHHDHGCWPPGHCKHGKQGKHGKHGKHH